MGFIEHTVRWPHLGGWHGWSWERSSFEDAVWGYDSLGASERFGVRQAGKHWLFVAPDRSEHDTMRELFASFRLRMCECERQTDQIEQLRVVLRLVADGLHRSDIDVFIMRAFSGSRTFAEHYVYWLERERIAACIVNSIKDVYLEREGQAILRMLDLTATGTNIDISPPGAIARYDELYPGRRLPVR